MVAHLKYTDTQIIAWNVILKISSPKIKDYESSDRELVCQQIVW